MRRMCFRLKAAAAASTTWPKTMMHQRGKKLLPGCHQALGRHVDICESDVGTVVPDPADDTRPLFQTWIAKRRRRWRTRRRGTWCPPSTATSCVRTAACSRPTCATRPTSSSRSRCGQGASPSLHCQRNVERLSERRPAIARRKLKLRRCRRRERQDAHHNRLCTPHRMSCNHDHTL